MTSHATPRFLLVLIEAALFCGASVVVRADDGKNLFNSICASCHGTDGRARTPAGKKLGARDLALSKLSDKQITFQIAEGRQDLSKKSNMPAFKGKLTPQQIKLLVLYVKGFRK